MIAFSILIAAHSRRASGDKPARALVVVVAKGSKIKSLTRTELKRTFSGEGVVIDDLRLVPFNYPPGAVERVAFDRLVLGMSPEEVGRFWVDRKIRGESQPPHTLPSAFHVAKIVAKFQGSISYLPADQLTDQVSAVAIDGVLPSAAGYPLQLKAAP